jgi:phosphatidylglycerophosphatase A
MTTRPYPPLHPVALAATWFGTGLLPGAPGTWGSIAALPAAWLLLEATGAAGLIAASVAAFALGVWACGAYARALGTEDPSACVLDEVAGQWLALGIAALAGPLTPVHWIAGFAAFRLFDILKPWPASWADASLSGGLGIMLDDMVAGAYAGIAVLALGHLLSL